METTPSDWVPYPSYVYPQIVQNNTDYNYKEKTYSNTPIKSDGFSVLWQTSNTATELKEIGNRVIEHLQGAFFDSLYSGYVLSEGDKVSYGNNIYVISSIIKFPNHRLVTIERKLKVNE